jgi:serine protease Do
MRHTPVLLLMALAGLSCGGAPVNGSSHAARMSAKDIYKAVSPAIVRLEVGDDKMGTGFIIEKQGLIASNWHVIVGESKIKVHTYDRQEYWVQSIAAVDKEHDLVLFRIDAKKPLPVVSLGDSNQMSPGDVVYAVGNPLGVFDYSISDGLISALRPWKKDVTLLQISAPISPGSSGGPLFNQYGEVIGLTQSIIAASDPRVITVENINMAIPINYIKPLIKQQVRLSVEDFARQSHDDEAALEDNRDETHTASTGPVDAAPPPRHVPMHPVEIWTGCNPEDVESTFTQIESAIEMGAPIYNDGVKPDADVTSRLQAFEHCFHIYEHTGSQLEKSSSCKGVRDAFGDGLLRASAITSFKDKAWAMRDAFDGLMQVAALWCYQNQDTCVKRAPSVHKLLESLANP